VRDGNGRAIAGGQQTVNLASISGRVTDQTGAVVAEAQVTARQRQANEPSTTTTDQEERFGSRTFVSVSTKSRCDSPGFGPSYAG